jgi:P-type Ca2+ transporter type 2C
MDDWNTCYQGLSTEEADRRLRRDGENVLAKQRSFSILKLVVSQFKSPMIAVLLGAVAVTLLLGDFLDALVISLAILVNTVLGFWQEYKAEKGLEKLSAVITPKTQVLRDGERVELAVAELVRGDVVFLEAGERVPFDGVLVEAHELHVNEALLTGESVPIKKKALAVAKFGAIDNHQQVFTEAFESLEERTGEATRSMYAGTLVAKGSGVMVGVFTGEETEVGKIAFSLLQTVDEPTPLQRQLGIFSRKLAFLVGGLAVGLVLFGLVSGFEFVEIFALAVALAVSAIPEGLVVSLTAILAVGMQRILKRQALVRKLVAAEVLGSVSVICTDKTGTITEGTLSVHSIDMVDQKLAMFGMMATADLKDPMEVAMWEWVGQELGEVALEREKQRYQRVDRWPFSAERKYSVTLTEKDVFMLGAPEVVLAKSRMSQRERRRWEESISELASKGYRLVALAHRKRMGERKISTSLVEKPWYWLGLVIYKDKVRDGVKRVFSQAQRAGMDIKVITGDFRETAVYVMKELGISVKVDEIMEGPELKDIDEHDLDGRIDNIRLFARTSPDQKLKIVESLQRKGKVVAMSGDGVNDAPALKKADIGVVVSGASDVSKETADLVLLNDDFSTIIAAVEEGRGIYENFRKVLLYLLSDSFTEVILIIGAMLLGLPLPVTAAQVLWVNLVNDGLPSLALTVDPKENDLLKRRPREKKTRIMDKELTVLVVLISAVTALLVLVRFWWQLSRGVPLAYAQTFAFAALATDSLFYVFSSRSLRKPIWRDRWYKNVWLILAVLAGFGVLLAAIYTPVFQAILGTVPLQLFDWLVLVIFSGLIIIIYEMIKAYFLEKKLAESGEQNRNI